MDLVDLNNIRIKSLILKARRDPCGSRGSKSVGKGVEKPCIMSRSLWISWI